MLLFNKNSSRISPFRVICFCLIFIVQGWIRVPLLAQTINAGALHSMAICTNKTAWTWGLNANGQLGDNTMDNQVTPVQVGGLSGLVAVSGGGGSGLGVTGHSLALKSDGTVWGWGENISGQLGDNTTANSLTPVQTSGLTNITYISAGYQNSTALKSDGTVWAWGRNVYGQLGDNTTSQRNSPVQVSGLSGITVFGDAGVYHSLVCKSDGTVWAWGRNANGQLGDNTTTNRYSPVQVSGLSNTISMAGGSEHSVVVKNDATVWAWGYNQSGQVGDNTTTIRQTPVQVTGLSNVTKVAAGYNHCLALKNDGTVWAWGNNSCGQIGDNTSVNKKTPVQVIGLGGILDVAGGSAHSLAFKSDGSVWAWGGGEATFDNYGQIGDGNAIDRLTPVQVISLCTVMSPPVPIELLHFTANYIKQADETYIVRCNWATASEINNNYFTIERSNDGYNFSDIGIRATQASGGNSTVPLYYQYDDLSPFSGLSYYRLRQTDINSGFTHSYIVPVFIGPMELVSIYPNPADHEVKAIIGVVENTDAYIEIFNALGQRVIEQKVILLKGTSEMKVNISHLAKGNYLFRVILPTKEQTQKMFVK